MSKTSSTIKVLLNDNSSMKKKLMDKLISRYSSYHLYCPVQIIELLLSDRQTINNFEDKLNKYFFKTSYINVVSILAAELFRQDLFKLQGLYINKIMKSQYLANNIISNDPMVCFTIVINNYAKLFTGRLISGSTNNIRLLLHSVILSSTSHLSISFPRMYHLGIANSALINATVADRLSQTLKSKSLKYDDLHLDYMSVEEYIDGVSITEVPKSEYRTIIQQVYLAVTEANRITGISHGNLITSNIRCRVLRKRSAVKYVLDGDVIWIRSKYLPVILNYGLEKKRDSDDIDTLLRSFGSSYSLEPFNEVKPTRGIFYHDDIKDNAISLKGINADFSHRKLPTTIIGVLYRYYSGSDRVDAADWSESAQLEQKKLEKHYIKMTNYRNVKELILSASSLDYHKKYSLYTLLKGTINKLQHISPKKRIELMELVVELQ